MLQLDRTRIMWWLVPVYGVLWHVIVQLVRTRSAIQFPWKQCLTILWKGLVTLYKSYSAINFTALLHTSLSQLSSLVRSSLFDCSILTTTIRISNSDDESVTKNISFQNMSLFYKIYPLSWIFYSSENLIRGKKNELRWDKFPVKQHAVDKWEKI